MKFRCKQSGCVVEFFYEHDIASMLEHPQYELVEEKPVEVEVEKEVSTKPKAK